MKAPDVQAVQTSFSRWERLGCPVGPEYDLREVWASSPYGKLRGDLRAPVPILAEQFGRKKKKGNDHEDLGQFKRA